MTIITFIIIGICGMLLLAIGIIFFIIYHQRRVFQHHLEMEKSQKEHEQQLQIATQEAQEAIMSHVAAELHDDVGVTLSSIKLFLSKAHNPDNQELLIQSTQLLDQSIEKIRTISQKLQPSTIQHLGLATSIQSLLDIIQKSGAIATQFSAPKKTKRLPENKELSLYRIVQEVLNNIIKHSGATTLSITLNEQSNELSIQLIHNGIGLTQALFQEKIYQKGSQGLKNILNRLKFINGTITFEQTNTSNYSIIILTPY